MIQPLSLKYFETVARTGSIRQASDSLFVAPSAISRQILNLEAEMKAQLFERTAQGMRLTAAGRILLQYAESNAARLGRVRREIDDLSRLAQGSITIATVEGTTMSFLPDVISRYTALHPGIAFRVLASGTHQIIEQVLGEAAEIGLAFNVPPREDLVLQGRISHSLRVIFRAGHALSGQASLTMRDLQDHALVLPDRSFGIRHLVEHAARAADTLINMRHESNSLQFIRALVCSTDLVSFMPRMAFEREEREGRMASAELDDPICAQSTIDVITARSRKLSAAARSFVDHIAGQRSL